MHLTAAAKMAKFPFKPGVLASYSSWMEKPSDIIRTLPFLYGSRVTVVLMSSARLTVVGSMHSYGRAMALMSQVPPQSILHGADDENRFPLGNPLMLIGHLSF